MDDNTKSRDEGKCVHFQPSDLVDLAEKYLRETNVPETDWEERRFHWGGEIDSPPFNGLILQCVRREGNWVIVKLDRRKQGVPAEDLGFKAMDSQ